MTINKIAIVDIETTGPNSLEGDRIIQLAAVIIENGEITARHSMYINPEMEIPAHITQLTGITQDKVASAPTFQQVAGLWYHRLKDCFFVAHNIAFDLTFLRNYFREFKCGEFHPNGFDTVKLAKIFLPEATGFNLTDLATYLQIPFEHAHDALADAEVTAYIMHEIAKRADSMPFATRVDLTPYLKRMKNQEHYILKHAKHFMLKSPLPHQSSVAPSHTSLTVQPHDMKQAAYLIEQWQQQPQLVVEQQHRPFSLAQQAALLQQLTHHAGNVLILCHSEAQLEQLQHYLPADKTQVLRTSDYYLHLKAFQELVLKVEMEELTQSEITTLAAIAYWQSYTQDLNMAQLNSELMTINVMLRKYVPHALRLNEHTSYKKSLQHVQRAPYLLTTLDNLPTIMENPSLQARQLIVLDLDSLTQRLHDLSTAYFPISEWFTKMRLMGDRIRFISDNRAFEELLTQGEAVNDAIHQLLVYTTDILKGLSDPMIEDEQLEHCMTKASTHHAQIGMYLLQVATSIQQFNVAMSKTTHLQLVLDDSDIYQIQQLSRQIQLFANLTTPTLYWQVTARALRDQFLNVRLSKRSFILPVAFTEWLNHYASALLLSNGNYHYLQSHGLFAQLKLSTFSYHILPHTHTPTAVTVQVPLSYIELPRESKASIQGIVDYIQTFNEDLACHIVIFAANKKMALELHRACAVIEDRLVMAQGVSGSLGKMKRRAESATRSLIIVQRHHAVKNDWAIEGAPTSMIIQSLPFISLTSCHVQAIAGESVELEERVFQTLLLPKMCRDFQQLIQYTQDYYDLADIAIFDDRVYTKYYSSECREKIQATINFEIVE